MAGPHTTTPIPTGRRAEGGLTKEDVMRIQRRRLLFAMAEAAADVGYASVAVSDVIKRARVSRATFYEQFRDKQDCFLAAFDAAVDILVGELPPLDSGVKEHELFPIVLQGYLNALAAHEAFARVFLIDIYAVGPEGARRRAESQRRFADLLIAVLKATTDEERFACTAFVAATSSMVTMKVASGESSTLPELHAPLLHLAEKLLGRV